MVSITWTLHEGDCLDVMHGFQDNSVDAVITDPPYGIDYQSAWRIDKTQWKPKIANDKQPFIWWIYDAYRKIKDCGALVCFCRWDVQEAFRQSIEWAGFTVKSQVIWDREHHGMGDLKSSFAPRHDVIWFAVKGKYKFPGKRPQSVIRSKRISGDALLHPNEKPIDLMIQLVNYITPPGGVIIDPFAGSGTTAVAAEQCGRNSILIEKEPKYCEVIKNRMAGLAVQDSLDFS